MKKQTDFISESFYKGGFLMEVIFFMSLFNIGYGIFGLFGKMNIPEKFKGHEWTKNYMKEL